MARTLVVALMRARFIAVCCVCSAAIALAALIAAQAARADVGDVDTTFNGDGIAITDFGPGPSGAEDVARQSDGKLVVVGHGTGLNGDLALARLATDGTLDPTFGNGGTTTTDFGQSGDAHAVAIQSDGKIVVGGSGGNSGGFALARFNADGTLDSSFGTDGQTIVAGTGGATGVADLAIQSDGKIVAIGSIGADSFGAARLNTDGSLDSTFSGDGIQKTTILSYADARGVAIQSDGKILIAGGAESTSDYNYNFAVVRYATDGSLDTTFSGDGIQTTDLGGLPDIANAVAVASDGSIVVAGVGGSDSGLGLVRYTTDGTLDTTFSGDGIQTVGASGVKALALQGDGKIVVGGSSATSDFAVTRFNADGTLDSSFSSDGQQTSDFTDAGNGSVYGMLVQPDGAVVAVGSTGTRESANFGIARYDSAGVADPAFGASGLAVVTYSGFDVAAALALAPDGGVVAAGYAHEDGSDSGDIAVARYLDDGTPDPAFGTDGRVTTDLGGVPRDVASAVAVQADGKIVVGGTSGNGVLLRYNSDGSLDSSFSQDGVASPFAGAVTAVAIDDQGRILAAGSSGGKFAIARLLADGTPDPSFSGDGLQVTDFGSTATGAARDLALAGDGKIVAIGSGGGSSTQVARYTSAGELDTSFSADGYTSVTFAGGTGMEQLQAVVVQPDGRILVGAGSTFAGSVFGPFELMRLDTAGSPDLTFSDDGQVSTDLGGSALISDLALRSDGTIVAAGNTSTTTAAVVRYLPDGELDTRFSADGIQAVDFSGTASTVDGTAVAADGDVLVAGMSKSTSADFAVARYDGGTALPSSDTAPPVISITTPADGEHFTQGQSVSSSFTCDDGAGSGVATCTGPATVDTSSTGTHQFTVTATDNASNQASKTVNYTVDAVVDTGGSGGTGSGTGGSTDTGGSGTGSGSADTSSGSGTGQTPPPGAPGSAPLPTVQQILKVLTAQLAPPAKLQKITGILAGAGISETFQALSAGTLQVQWFYVPPGAKIAKAKPVLVAQGTQSFAGAGKARLKLKLTAAGRKLLKKAKKLKLTAKGTFTPKGGKPVSSLKKFGLKR